jgi:hypothetical protein
MKGCKTGGRARGVPNKRTVAAKVYPDALDHLARVMTATVQTDPLILPDMKLRAAIALAAYQHSKPAPSHTEAFVTVNGYAAPATVEEARALILGLGERLARGEISVIAHDALINGLKVFSLTKQPSRRRYWPGSKPPCAPATHERDNERHMSFESRALRLEREHGRAGANDIVVTVAADFLHGGQPTFARPFDRRGSMIGTVQRAQGEGWAAFRARGAPCSLAAFLTARIAATAMSAHGQGFCRPTTFPVARSPCLRPRCIPRRSRRLSSSASTGVSRW